MVPTPKEQPSMNDAPARSGSATAHALPEVDAAVARVIHHPASGRRVVFDLSGSQGEIEVRGAGGELELRIRLTAEGPVLSVSAARIELNAVDAVAVRCGSFEVDARDGARITSEGPMELASTGDMRIDGERLLLNCDPDM
jgi:hypothetical protein